MHRVLFVDDDPNVLEGLQRMLRSQRRHWRMSFVESGEAALEEIAAHPYDVIVSDMRMPGMDGATLLRHVQERHPRTVRIVLTGYGDTELALRSASISHQFLSKPCSADLLRDVVERACGLDRLLHDPRLQKLVGSLEELPVLPRTYRELGAALADSEVDLGTVATIAERDSAIAAKILQLVNSSFFAPRTPITSIRHATSYLGAETIRDLALTVGLFRQFEDLERFPGFSFDREQEHSLLAARLAYRVVEDPAVRDQAVLAAMLHDVGRLVLAAQMPDELAAVLRMAAEERLPIQVVERRLLGAGHAEIGAYLLGLWGLPYPIVEAVAHHHAPSAVEPHGGFDVLAAVHVAEALAREVEAPHEQSRLDVGFLDRVGVLDRIEEWRAAAAEEVARRQPAAADAESER